MPLTADEKARARMYLGYPSVNRLSHQGLEGALAVVDGDESALVLIRELLAELAALDLELAASRGRLKAAKVDDVQLLGPAEVRALRAEGQRLVERLGSLLDVRILRDPYGGGAISGTVRRG